MGETHIAAEIEIAYQDGYLEVEPRAFLNFSRIPDPDRPDRDSQIHRLLIDGVDLLSGKIE